VANTIYSKLARYFIGLMVVTCMAVVLLYFVTVGYPMARDFHRLMRKQIHYIAGLTEAVLEDNSTNGLAVFLKNTSESYEMSLVLLDNHGNTFAAYPESAGANVHITDAILKDINASGRFVRPGHLSKPTIYVLPVSAGNGKNGYLYVTKHYSLIRAYLLLLCGLVILCVLLIIAIYPLSRSFTRPVTELSHALNGISSGDFDQKISFESRNDEFGELLRAFQKMSRSVNRMIETRKELLADISHEIRSPLSRMRVTAELLRDDCGDSQSCRHIGTWFRKSIS
jgi:signal transduction histidine kinase